MNKKTDSETSHGEYVFRYPLNPKSAGSVPAKNALNEMIRQQLETLLGVVALTYKGKKVEVDGFVNLNEPNRLMPHQIFRDKLNLPGDNL